MTWEGDIVAWRDCIQTKPSGKKSQVRKGDDLIRRVAEINSKLIDIFKTFNIQLIVSELPYGYSSKKASLMVGIVSGVLQTIADFKGIPLEWYSEKDAKSARGLTSPCPKDKVMESMSERYGLRFEYKTNNERTRQEAMADAMLIYHCATVHSPFLAHLRGVK